jgi:aspartyl/glutamyl-tRNA(Asn/Gln) amidotransferase C subunit
MPGLDNKQIEKLARLARLAIEDAEAAAVAPELSRIVAHMDRLRSVDTSGVVPMTHGAPLTAGPEDPEGGEPDAATAAEAAAHAVVAAVAPVLGRAAVAGSAGYDSDDGTVRVPRVVD